MVRGGGGFAGGPGDGRKQYITMEVISRKGIQYIQLYTAISREEFFQYMFILYYFFKAMRWGRGLSTKFCR
jgi:hypothetical protein